MMNRVRNLSMAFAALALWLAMSGAYATPAPVPATGLTSALQWRSVGPYLGGRVTSVAGIASEPNRNYAAYAGGGVWETDDYGTHWNEISAKDFGTGNVGAIDCERSSFQTACFLTSQMAGPSGFPRLDTLAPSTCVASSGTARPTYETRTEIGRSRSSSRARRQAP